MKEKKELKKNIAGSSNGRTAPSGGVYLGSSPSPAANEFMKLISLNTWGGRIHEPLVQFLQTHQADTDFFCFQEVDDNPPEPLRDNADARQNLFSELKTILSEHVGYFAPQIPGSGIATFVRKTINVASSNFSIVLSTEEMTEKFIPRILQHISIQQPVLSIYNFHGVPKSEKLDTPERNLQTDRILEILSHDTNPKILVGDFNLRPNTDNVHAFERNMRNLVIERGFRTTRSRLYNQLATQPFADYSFVSPDISVKDFQVLTDEISDHLPLFTEFQ